MAITLVLVDNAGGGARYASSVSRTVQVSILRAAQMAVQRARSKGWTGSIIRVRVVLNNETIRPDDGWKLMVPDKATVEVFNEKTVRRGEAWILE